MKHLFSIILTVAVLAAPAAEGQELKHVYVTIRVDDIFMRESPIRPQEVSAFVEACERHGAKVMLAVIPHRLVEDQNNNGEMAKALKDFVKRGHLVSMHSYTHQCSRCGSSGHEYFCTRDSVEIPLDMEGRELAEGKGWLEEATGRTVTTFVGAGTDDQTRPQTIGILKRLGIHWITNDGVRAPVFRDTLSYVPDLEDYTWDLQDSTYVSAMKKAQSDFGRAMAGGNYFSFAAHDHFTRRNFNNGIVIRWTDEFLSFIDSFPHITVHYVTIDDFRKEWFNTSGR